MSLHKEIEQEAAHISAQLLFKRRVFAYFDGDEISVKDRMYCNGGLVYLGTYDNDMDKQEVVGKLKFWVDCAMTKGHIPSSLGKHLDVMRQEEV